MDTPVTYGLYLSESVAFILGVQGKHSVTMGPTQLKQEFRMFLITPPTSQFRWFLSELGKTKDAPQACCMTFTSLLARQLQDQIDELPYT